MSKLYPVTIVEHPTYLTTYEWERFDLQGWREWIGERLSTSIYCSIAYVLFIFVLEFYMRNRPPFKLKKSLTAWNIFLAALSAVMFLRTSPEFIHVLSSTNGLHKSLCQWTSHNHATAFWTWLFLLSKILEFGDTLFIVLRKRKLLFLHWYHHASTLVCCWVVYQAYEPYQLWMVVVNTFIHSLMYSYYALTAFGVKIPRHYSMAITSLQILQMAIYIALNIYTANLIYFQGVDESGCYRTSFNLNLSSAIFLTYFALFAHFFYTTYLSGKKCHKFANGTLQSNGHGNHVKKDY